MGENKKSRRDQAEGTKRHIFHTALKLLDEYGFEKIKIRDIVRAADVSIGAFYHYYNSKMDVFYETYHLADEYFEETVLPLLTQKSAKERISCFFDHYAKYCSEITSLALTSILYNSKNKHFERPGDRGILRVLTEQMDYGLARQELRKGDSPGFMARFFLISIRGLVYNWCINDGSYNLSDAVRLHVDRLLQCY